GGRASPRVPGSPAERTRRGAVDPARGDRAARHRRQPGPGDAVSRRLALGCMLAVMGCSSLTEGQAGVVGIEVRVPGPDSVEVGESIQLGARPLDKNGDSAAAAVTWVSVDPTATIDPATGVLT